MKQSRTLTTLCDPAVALLPKLLSGGVSVASEVSEAAAAVG